MAEIDNLKEDLMRFGLTRQEATFYLLLLEHGKKSGYEAAKMTGVSRSNTYAALAGLVEKGAAMVEEGSATHYVPVEIREFTGNVLTDLKCRQKKLIEYQPSPKTQREGYLTIEGNRHVMDKIRNMILNAQLRIYFAAPAWILRQYQSELMMQLGKGIKVVLMAEASVAIEGSTFYQMKNMIDQIRLIVDSSTVLTGNLARESDSVCLYSKNKNLVDVFKEMLRSEIVLLEQQHHVTDTVLVAMPKEI